MDVLSHLLEPIEVRGSVFCHGPVRAPWRFEGGAQGRCLFHCIVDGSAWVSVPGREPFRVGAGDVVLIPRGRAHLMGSEPEGDAVPLREAVTAPSLDAPFARFRIGGDGPVAHLICGSFEVDGMDWHPLLRALPEVIAVDSGAGRWLSTTLRSLERYLSAGELGAELVTRRLTEVLFVQTLAAWLRRGDASEGWLRALRDEQIGRAIALMHSQPAEDWTAERLGRTAGLSRSAFYGRFRERVGEPPARYLLRWRMTLAARALAREDVSVAEVCARVGYASVPSFTKAFRNHFGETPGAYRRAHREAS